MLSGNGWDISNHMAIEESKFSHVRIPHPESEKLAALADINDRSIQAEGLRAIRNHIKPDAELIEQYLAEQRKALKRGDKVPGRKL